MGFKAFIFITVFSLLCLKIFSQDYFSYGGGNFSGLSQVISNPAAAADNRLKFDFILAGVDANFNNSWFGIKRDALHYTGGIAHPVLPQSWKNATPNVPDNVFKNFVAVASHKEHALIVENRILLPSVLYQINAKNSIAFTWSVRQIANADGISQQFGNLFEKELDLSVTQNNRVQNKNLSAVQMSWAEYGFTYARVLKDKNQHFMKAGITPKIIQGLESTYLVIRDLDFLLSTKDTLSYFKTKLAYAHSDNVRSPLPVSGFYRHVTAPTVGLDLGFIYEWRPRYQQFKYRPDGKNYAWRKDQNKYKLKIGASLVDIGRVKFQKQGTSYDLDVSLNKDNFTEFTSVKDFAMFDSLLRAKFSNQNGSSQFKILLPTAFNTQVDYSLNRFFYLNLSAHVANFYKANDYRVHNYTAICFAPRIEHYWFDVSLPITYNTLSASRSQYLMAGLNVRLGPLSVGTSNMVLLFKGDIYMFNLYAVLRVAVPYKQIKDKDGDGVTDKNDKCPDAAGEVALNGCPDADHDLIADKDDACPHQPGLPAFRGCPDTDGDGISDGNDLCPIEKGTIALGGCPDKDNDGIADKDDNCPDAAGPKQFKGCPDTDGDGIIDKDDLCPTVKGFVKYKGCLDRDNDGLHDGIDQCPDIAGPVENKGCPWPDTDKDGIIDLLDSCIHTPGVAAFKGCPAPVKLAAVEKRIIQKAYSTLEFTTGKDVIKPVSFASLNALAKLLVAHTADWTIKLTGHTDNEGTEEGNLILSEKRAKAVQAYLVKKGAAEKNTAVEWFGQSRPLADNATKAGQQKNRRVEMVILLRVDP